MNDDKVFHFFDEKLDCIFDILLTEPPANDNWQYKVELWCNRLNDFDYLHRYFDSYAEADNFFLRLRTTLLQGYGGLYLK